MLEAAAPGHVERIRASFVDLLEPDEIAVLTRVAERVVDAAQAAGCSEPDCDDDGPA